MACHGLPWDDASSRKFGPTTKVDKKRSLENRTFPGLQDDEAKAVEEYARRRAEEALAKPFGELEGSDEEYLDDKDLKDKQKKETELKKPGDGEREQAEEFVMNLKADYILKFLNNLLDLNILKENFDLMVNFLEKNLPRRVHERVKKAKVEFSVAFKKGLLDVALDDHGFVEVDEYPLVDLKDWGEFNEVDLEQESEEAGPPDVSEEMLTQLELEADERL
ncbi:unnamed protein product [Durusdinium trenchii]|uniref:Uncharacterized protein n=1 Tax=Durusdinium trenchii TaxID=1381693 RepID=A0ABP0K353_9DINO